MAFKIAPDELDQLDPEHALALLGLHPKQDEAKQTVAAALGAAPKAVQSGLNAPETPNGVSVAAPAAIGAQGNTPASPAIGIKAQADQPEASGTLKAAVAAPGMGGAMPAVAAPKTQRQMDEAELQRLTSTGSGVHQIKNPFLHGLAKVGDVALSALFPRVAQFVPGTEMHHDVLVGRERRAVANDSQNDERDAQTKEANARADAADNKVQGTWGLLQDKNGKVIGFKDDKGNMHSLDSPDVPPELHKIATAAGEKDRNTQFLETDQGMFKVGDDGNLTPATYNGKPLNKAQKASDADEYADDYAKSLGKKDRSELSPQERLKARKDFAMAGSTHITNAAPVPVGEAGAAVEHVPEKLRGKAMEDAQKAGDAYASSLSAANDVKTFINLARSGNKLAYSYEPVLGVLTINTDHGTKRINMSEIAAYGGAGSGWDKVQAFFGKQASGSSIPADVLDDMEAAHAALAKNSKTLYGHKLAIVNGTYGAQFKPIEFGDDEDAGDGKPDASDPAARFGGKTVKHK